MILWYFITVESRLRVHFHMLRLFSFRLVNHFFYCVGAIPVINFWVLWDLAFEDSFLRPSLAIFLDASAVTFLNFLRGNPPNTCTSLSKMSSTDTWCTFLQHLCLTFRCLLITYLRWTKKSSKRGSVNHYRKSRLLKNHNSLGWRGSQNNRFIWCCMAKSLPSSSHILLQWQYDNIHITVEFEQSGSTGMRCLDNSDWFSE